MHEVTSSVYIQDSLTAQFPNPPEDAETLIDMFNRGVLEGVTPEVTRAMQYGLVDTIKAADPERAQEWLIYLAQEEYDQWLSSDLSQPFVNLYGIQAALTLYGAGQPDGLEKLATVTDILSAKDVAKTENFDSVASLLHLINTSNDTPQIKYMLLSYYASYYDAITEGQAILASNGFEGAQGGFNDAYRAKLLVNSTLVQHGYKDDNLDTVYAMCLEDIDLYDRLGLQNTVTDNAVLQLVRSIAQRYSPYLLDESRLAALSALAELREECPDDMSLRKTAKRVRGDITPRLVSFTPKRHRPKGLADRELAYAQRAVAGLRPLLLSQDMAELWLSTRTIDDTMADF